MNTAIDTSVLLAIFNGEPSADEWLTALISARSAGRLIICEVVYAELAPAFTHAEILDEKLALMGIEVVSINKESAWGAGKAFQQYRKSGGPRAHLIPDFLIAAHAQNQAGQIAAVDRGYLRKWFPLLVLAVGSVAKSD